MRYSEIRRDPLEDERELAKKVDPGKLPSWREFIGNKAHEIRRDGNGGRRKAITLRSINKHRKWLERRAREFAEREAHFPRMYSVEVNDDDQQKDKSCPKPTPAPTTNHREKVANPLSPLSLGD